MLSAAFLPLRLTVLRLHSRSMRSGFPRLAPMRRCRRFVIVRKIVVGLPRKRDKDDNKGGDALLCRTVLALHYLFVYSTGLPCHSRQALQRRSRKATPWGLPRLFLPYALMQVPVGLWLILGSAKTVTFFASSARRAPSCSGFSEFSASPLRSRIVGGWPLGIFVPAMKTLMPYVRPGNMPKISGP